MHTWKRTLTSAIALLLCFLTVFSCAFAYTEQQATAGYPQPPTYKGGTNSGNSTTNYTDPVIVGYRFTCWRSTDWQVAQEQGLVTPSNSSSYYKAHNEAGYKLGHSINIMCNATTSDGGSRTDYANAYSQTGIKSPHMLTNGEQTDFLDKISLAQLEQKTDASMRNTKLTHSTATGLMCMDYSGATNGKLNDVSESSTFEFYTALRTYIDKDYTDGSQKNLSSAFNGVDDDHPLVLYSGYYTWNRDYDGYLNTSPDNEFEANNLYTYIYGFRYKNMMGSNKDGYDMSDYTTISDIDYDGSDVLPFNQEPSNIISSGNPNTWVNRNTALIATLCGLEPAYGQPASTLTDEQFGVYDYIIVEPIMMYYYYYTRYYVTTSDTAIIQAQSMSDKVGYSADVWTSVYYGGYKLFDVCGKFPASFGTYIYTEEQYFGVDGVFNATTQRGYSQNAFKTSSRDGLHLDAIASDSQNKSGNADRKYQPSNGFNTYAFVFTDSSGYTLFGGGDSNMTRGSIDMAQMRIRTGGFFLAPYIAVESLIGTGIFMSGEDGPLATPKYEIVYHANTNNGGQNTAQLLTQKVTHKASSAVLYNYTALSDEGLTPVGKIPSNYWTFTSGNNDFGIQDNTISSIASVYPNASKGNGKVETSTTLSGWSNIESFFNKYGTYNAATNTTTVDLYAAWNTKSLVTTIDRTYESSKAQTTKDAALYDPSGKMWFTEINSLPTAISVVQTQKGATSFTTSNVKDIIGLQRDTTTGYQWFQKSGDTGTLDDTNSDYYIVYSFSKSSITDSDKTAIINSLNGGKQNELLIYRNNGSKVKWSNNDNLFYFDFYTFSVEAPNCAISATVYDYPDADQTIQKQGTANGLLQMKLVRGSQVQYTVTPDNANSYYFDLDKSTTASLSNWTNGVEPHILPDNKVSVQTSQQAVTNKLLQYYQAHTCLSCKKHTWDDSQGECKCPGCGSTNYSTPTNFYRAYYPASNTSEVLGKQQHKYTVETGKLIQVVPYVDNVQVEPFADYSVDIVNNVTGQRYVYSATPMTGAIEIPADAKGTVLQAIAGNGLYTVYVSATDGSGRNHMKAISTVQTNSVAQGGTAVVRVDYYTSSIQIQTQSGGNHAGITADMFYTESGYSDIEQAISIVSTDHTHNSSKTCSLCSETNYAYAEGIALKGLQLNVIRDSNSDWYLTSAKQHTNVAASNGSELVSGKPQSLSFEIGSSDEGYSHTRNITSPYHLTYTFAPYHYIQVTLDNQDKNVDDIGITAPSGYEVVNGANGYKVLRGSYGSSISSISSIINGTNNTHVGGTSDKLSLTYRDDAVVYTTLRYYTVSTDADRGYCTEGSCHTTHTPGTACSSCSTTSHTGTKGAVLASDETSASYKAYILSSHTNYSIFTSCASGNPFERDDEVVNTRSYKAFATLHRDNKYADTSVNGKLTVNGTKYTKQTTLTDASVATITRVNAPSTLYWRSNQTRYDLKFIFRVNDVPYDSLPATVNNNVSLNGTDPLTFSTDASGNVIATGKAVAGTYTLYLDGKNTGMQYTVTESTTANVYTIDFYTLRVAAGTGVTSVSIKPTDKGDAWNGTLPYYRDGRNFATTLAVWPASMDSSDEKIYINAMAEGEYLSNGNIVSSPDGYSFKRWDTKRPTSGITIKYANNSATTTTTRDTYVIASAMNHATVVQAEATPQGTPIDIPTFPEHNSVYYGVKVRTFLDGRLKTPWDTLTADMTLSASERLPSAKVVNGVAPWATVLDLVDKKGNAVTDPYKGMSASAVLAPSLEYQNNGEINTEYFYSASNAYVANKYVYIDAFYYTQTIQTQVNGVNTPPWSVGSYYEVIYRQRYKSSKVDTSIQAHVNNAGVMQTIMLKGMEMYEVGGLPAAKTNPKNTDFKILYNEVKITGNHTFIIPYYTVDMKAYCSTNDVDINCSSLTLTFNGTNMKTSVSANKPALVMAGSYTITTTDSGSSHSDGHTSHSFLGWDILSNEVFVLEYVDSGDGKQPYPVLTYTGESRASSSTLASKTSTSTTLNVNDETHLMARYAVGDSVTYTLKLNSKYYDSNGNLISTGTNPLSMFRGDSNGNKASTANGETNKYGAGDKVHIGATLDPQTVYQPTKISVSFTMKCYKCGTVINPYHESITKCPSCNTPLYLQNATGKNTYDVVYAAADSYATVQALMEEASFMEPTAAAEYLAANHVVPMVKNESTGKYEGVIPYAETVYHLYVNGLMQEGKDVQNTWKKEFVFGKPGNTGVYWDGTAGINGGSATTIGFSDFDVTMDKNREYTVYARQVITGTLPSNTSVDFMSVTVYTSTDYTPAFPYTKTKITVNGTEMVLNTSKDSLGSEGFTFYIAKGSQLVLEAQNTSSNTYKQIFDGTITTNKSFLLSYNTVTVAGPSSLNAGIIMGTDANGNTIYSQKQTWLAAYAVDNGSLTSINTQYSIGAEGGSTTNKTFVSMQSTVNVNTTGGQILELVATTPYLSDSQELIGSFSGDSEHYLYVLENTAANRLALKDYYYSQHESCFEKYIIGFSTKSDISGNLAKQNAVITFNSNTEYDVIVDWSTMKVNVVARAGTRFRVGAPAFATTYKFNSIPNGTYEIHMNGTPLVTSNSDIKNTSGTVTTAGDGTITVTSTATIKASTNTKFSKWNDSILPGTAATNIVKSGTASTSTSTAAKRSTLTLTGTTEHIAQDGSGVATQSSVSAGTVTIPSIVGYKVEVYLDDVLQSPFASPVKVNNELVEIRDGASKVFYSINMPKVNAVSNSHDTGYTLEYGNCDAITYDASTHTFKVYYYTVTYSVHPTDETWGTILPTCNSQEDKFGPVYVAKGTTVTLEGTTLTIATPNILGHGRVPSIKNMPGYEIEFVNWTRNNPKTNASVNLTQTITTPTHFVATFKYQDGGKEYKVTLYNETANFYGKILNTTTDEYPAKIVYNIKNTLMTGGITGNVVGNAPNSIADTYLYGGRSTMTASVTSPTITGTANSSVNITLTLTGYTSERAHTVQLKGIDNSRTYTVNVPANGFVATFSGVQSGYYQLYIDNIKYVTKFSYNTHDTTCKVNTSTGACETPNYGTESGKGGILYVAPQYTVRYSYVSHWSQVRYDRTTGEYTEYFNQNTCTDTTCSGYGTSHQNVDHIHNWTSLDKLMDPSSIRYNYQCNVCGTKFSTSQTGSWSNKKATACTSCGSTHIRMTDSVLVSPDIDEDLDYYVYSGYSHQNYAPINIAAEVEMAYPVYLQAVVDGVEKYPFSNSGASAQLYYTDGNVNEILTAPFDENGLATFFVPMGTEYYFIGAHNTEWMTEYSDGGFSLTKPYSDDGLQYKLNPKVNKVYINGDGDYDNDNNIDDPGLKYYVHYYTVTAQSGHGIASTNIYNGNNTQQYHTDNKSVTAVFQRGATARVTAAISDGYLPVSIRVTRDNETYTGREVYLSTSSTTNSKNYKLTYNANTGRYEHNSVYGAPYGTTYYVWVNGKYVNGTATLEYTGLSVFVRPFKEPVTWSGNCPAGPHSTDACKCPSTHRTCPTDNGYQYCSECNGNCSTWSYNHLALNTLPHVHTFTVYHTTTEQADAQDNVAKYTYRYASDHPTDPDSPTHDPEDPDNKPEDYPDEPNLDDIPENTVYYYTLEVTGDAGTNNAVGSGTYLEGAKPSVSVGIQGQRTNIGRTPIKVTLYLDGKLWAGQKVTIGGYTAKEISSGVYQTDYNFASGTYAVRVTSPDTTLLDTTGLYNDTTIYGYITVSSTRTYTWKAWTDGHVKCSTCGVVGACCIANDTTHVTCNTSTTVYCTNCHRFLDANSKEQSCCTNKNGHKWTTCPYSGSVYSGDCLANLGSAHGTRANTITMKHNSKLHGTTTHVDKFTFTGDNAINFYTLHIDGDAGVDKVTIDGKVYEETKEITTHGVTANNSGTYDREMPNRTWTSTYNERTFFKEVVAREGRNTSISVTTKPSVTNHTESKTPLSVIVTLDDEPYTGRTVTIGGYPALDSNNDGIYITTYSGFVGGAYDVMIDGELAGQVQVTATRTYRWHKWNEPWVGHTSTLETSHQCVYHNSTHTCASCVGKLGSTVTTNANVVNNQTAFTSLVARTEILDTFVVLYLPNGEQVPTPGFPYYKLIINEFLNNTACDDFPIKFENFTTGETLYMLPEKDGYTFYDVNGKQHTNVSYVYKHTDGTITLGVQKNDEYRISVMTEIEDKNNNDVLDVGDINLNALHKYTYTTHTEGTMPDKQVNVRIDYYTLTLDVYSDGAHKLPDFGKQVNGTNNTFNNPVWLDDVVASNDGTADSNGDTDVKPVVDHHTVKVYLKGTTYDVDVKTADDDNTGTNNKPGTGYLAHYQSDKVNGAVTIRVDYYSMTTDHHGGFTGTQINYKGQTHVSASTTAGATGNAVAKAFFLKGEKVDIDATVAKENTWYQWTGNVTYSTKNQTSIVMDQKRAESAWAKTYVTVRHYLHDKHEGWYYVAEDTYTKTGIVIDNRGWNTQSITGEPNKYVNFDAFRTHSFADPSVKTTPATLRDVLTKGVNTTTVSVVVDANQVGGQSFVDFYYTRNGSKVDPTPDTPTLPDPVPQPPEAPTPTPQPPEDWNVDEQQEYVTITYVMNGGTYNGSKNNYSETHLVGTDITTITPTPPAGQEFVGWFLTNLDGTTQSASGLIGEAGDHYLLCKDTTVYAVYIGKLDLGITANDIYGVIKTGSQFTSSATIVNHNNSSITPNTHINAVLTIKNGNTVVNTIKVEDVIVPGNGTQMISVVVPTDGWSASKTYTLTWSLDFSESLYVDRDSSNNTSSLQNFKPGAYSAVVNTARPGYSTERPGTYNKNTTPSSTSNTAFAWEYWTWNENSGYNGKFAKQTGSDKMNIVLLLTPENESGLRTYTKGAFNIHNYTTRSGYGLSMHRVYDDLAGTYKNGSAWVANKSHITLNSTVGRLEALMTFPEFNYNSTYNTATGSTQEYRVITVANAGSYYSLTMPGYSESDYETDDWNDRFAHYTPMWLPDGEYKPVTHISGMWTPIGELRATVQQGQYTSTADMHNFGIYTNEVIIKGSLYDDLYNNP